MKVVINSCFGGFSLSEEAVKLGRKLSGNIAWGGPCLFDDTYSDGTKVGESDIAKKCGFRFLGGGRDIPRNDEYDGSESIHEEHRSWC